MPAWRSILTLAKGSNLGRFARQGIGTVAQQDLIFLSYGRGILLSEKCGGEGRKGGQITINTNSRNVYSSSFAQFLHPFLHLRAVLLKFSPNV